MEDREIVALFFRRDEDAIRETDLRYGADLYSLSLRILENREDAEENRNDTYLKTWRSIPPARPLSLRAWLMKLCRTTAFDRLKHDRAKKRSAVLVSLTDELADCIPDSRQEERFREEELGELINGFLSGLTVRERAVFLDRYFAFRSCREIASGLHASEGNIRIILWRLRKNLREYLESEGIRI